MDSSILLAEVKKIEEATGKKMLTVEDTAKYLSMSSEEVSELVKRKEILSVEIIGKVYIMPINLANWLVCGIKKRFTSSLDFTLTSALHSTHFKDVSEEEFEMARREKGLGSVYYNEKRKCWQAAFYMIVDGEKKRKIISAKSEYDAIMQMGQLKSGKMAYTSKEELPKEFQEKHRIIDINNYLLENIRKPNCTSRTYRWYVDMSKYFKGEFGDKYIEDLTSEDIIEFLNSKRTYTIESKKSNTKREKQTSDKTLREISNLLKCICTYALEEGYVRKNPYNKNVRRPKGIKNDPLDKVLKKDMATLLMSIASKNIVFKTVVYSLLITGMRIGEFLGLQWSDLDRENNTIHIKNATTPDYEEGDEGMFINKGYKLKDTKTEAGTREIPVDPSIFKVLDDWKEYMSKDKKRMKALEDKGNTDLVFPNDEGEIRSYSGLRRSFENYLKANGLGDAGITFHCLRKTLGTGMSDAGVRLEVIAAYLGHEPEGHEVTHKHYARVNLKPMREAAKAYYEYMKDVFELAQ